MSSQSRRGRKHVRVSAKALIVESDSLLVIRKCDPSGDEYVVLPGGGQDVGESLIAAVQRECLEEIGVRVEPIRIVYVRDYIGANHEFAAKHSGFHQLEIVFLCTLVDDPAAIGGGSEEDPGQIGIEWIRLTQICDEPLYPKALRSHISGSTFEGSGPIYLGDVN